MKSGDRVALEGLFTVSIFAKVICFVLLTVLVISEIVFLFGAPTATQAQFEFPAILFPPAMALALLSFIYISKWIFGSDVRWLSDEIEKALNSVEK